MIRKDFKLSLMVLSFGLFLSVNIYAQNNSLIGTWILNIDEIPQLGEEDMVLLESLEITYGENGHYETTINNIPVTQGIYNITNGSYTIQVNSVYGSHYGLESRWYTEEEIRNTIRNLLGQLMYDGIFQQMFDEIFIIESGVYSVNGNILTMRKDEVIESFTFFRK